MIAAVGAMFLVTVLAGGALAAANGDLHLVRHDLDDKRAFAAAQAGIGDYSFHLNHDNNYWAKCTSVPSPHAVNQQGSTANRRFVPGSTDASYAIELLPATGQSACNPANPIDEHDRAERPQHRDLSHPLDRLRGGHRAVRGGHIQARQPPRLRLLHPARDLGPGELRLREPVGRADRRLLAVHQVPPRGAQEPADSQLRWPATATEIVFVTGDQMKGPLHTNDDLLICGTPSFGRTAADVIEVSAPPQGWQGDTGCSGNQPNFVGPLVTTAPVLTPPATNGKLKTIAGPSYTYTGQTTIALSGTNMTRDHEPGHRGADPDPVERRGLRQERRLLGQLQPVHGHLSELVGLRERPRAAAPTRDSSRSPRRTTSSSGTTSSAAATGCSA